MQYDKNWVKDACFIFCSEELYGTYDTFLEFLMQETDQRSVLPHYFYSLFEDNALVEKGFENLGSFFYSMLLDKSVNYLLSSYMEDIRNILTGLKSKEIKEEIEKVFSAYEDVRKLMKHVRKNSDGFSEKVLQITNGVKAAEDWFQ